MIPDARIEALMLQAGHKPREAVRPETLRIAFALLAEEAIKACEAIAERYPVRPGLHAAPTQGDHLIRQSRNVAQSCAAAVREALTNE